MNNVQKWYMNDTCYDDVVVCSGVRLSRNLAEFDFSEKINSDDAEKLIAKVRALVPTLSGRESQEYYSCNMARLSQLEKEILLQFGVISPELAKKKQAAGLIVSEDESISVMINEEDHLQITAFVAGSNLREAARIASKTDDYFDSELHYAYSDKYGYLTSSITNVGTGMHASYLLSLPALTMSDRISSIKEEIGKFGVLIKSVYAEDNKSKGFLYTLTNQKTLGCTEQEIIENLDQIAGQVIALERKRRTAWIDDEHDDVEDKVFRSYGVLRYTRYITDKDALMLLAQLKLGSDTGLIELTGNGADIYRLMLEIQPANIKKLYRVSDEHEVNRFRARFLNEKLPRIRSAEL